MFEIKPVSAVAVAMVAGALSVGCGAQEETESIMMVSRAATGTAAIDGVRSAGEWDGALTFSVFSGANAGSTFFVMNDATNLYVALELAGDASLGADDIMEVRFDDANNDLTDDGDDELFVR